MIDETPRQRLANIIADRAREDYDLADPTPSALVHFLMRSCDISEETATALVWAEEYDVAVDEMNSLALAFDFERELLSCILQPTSTEVIMHALEHAQNHLDTEDCAFCEKLYEEIDTVDVFSPLPELHTVCLDVLLHVGVSITLEEDDEDDYDSDYEEDFTLTVDPIVGEIAEVVMGLDHDSRRRILLYAYHEAAQKEEYTSIRKLSAYGTLKDAMTPLAVTVFNELCQHDDGLTRRELQQRLSLPDARALGQIPRSFDHTLRTIRQTTSEIEQTPFIAVEDRMKLSEETRNVWQNLLKAERKRASRKQ